MDGHHEPTGESCLPLATSGRENNRLTSRTQAQSAHQSRSKTGPFRCPGAGACSRKGCTMAAASASRRPCVDADEQYRQVADGMAAVVAEVDAQKAVVLHSSSEVSSRLCFSFARNSPTALMVSASKILSWSSLPGSLPWCYRSWCPSDTPGIGGTLVEPVSMIVTSRVESV